MTKDETERLYRAHADALMRFATTVVGPDHAYDVFADAWIRATNSPAWKSTRSPVAVLYRTVLNTARNRTRADRRREMRELRVAVPDTAPMIDPTLRLHVEDALRSLSGRQRAVLHLTYWEDRTPSEIAELLGIGHGTVKRHLARARQRMRELL